jgi:lysophospholipase L1-like esterase
MSIAGSPPASPADDSVELTDPYCVSPGEGDLLLAGAPWRRFSVIGDSLAEGLGEARTGYLDLPWADRVREAILRIQPELVYQNLGYRGLLAAEVRDGQLAKSVDFGPDLATVVAGGNDLFGIRFDADAVEAAIDEMVGALTAAGALVITFGLMDVAAAWPQFVAVRPRMKLLNDRVRAVSDRHDTVFVDMWDHPVCSDLSAYSADMKHTSMRGHAILAAETIKALSARLARSAG